MLASIISLTVMEIRPKPAQSLTSSANGSQALSNMAVLDSWITNKQEIKYKGGLFKNQNIVNQFTTDHKPLNTAMLGTSCYLYIDPCTCCLPSHGQKHYEPEIADATGVITYVKNANPPLDVLFTSNVLYNQVKDSVAKYSPTTKIIVFCARDSNPTASDLRKQNIPAIDDSDYLDCYPLNAVIALTVFDEMMSV